MILYLPDGVPFKRASLMAASLASVPLLQKKLLPPQPVRSARACPNQRLWLRVPAVRHMDQLLHLFRDGFDNLRRAMAEHPASPAGEEVEIAISFRVPDPGAFATH